MKLLRTLGAVHLGSWPVVEAMLLEFLVVEALFQQTGPFLQNGLR